MKTRITHLLFALLATLPGISFAQLGMITAIDDSICVFQGQDIMYNVTSNDIFDSISPGMISVFWAQASSPCIDLESNGDLSFSPEAMDCCDKILKYVYRHESCDDSTSKCFAEVTVMVKCPKPDCFFVNMEDFTIPDPAGQDPSCAFACENSASTYFITYNPTSTYSWSVTGGTYLPGPNPASILVTWGPTGLGAVSLTITNGGATTTINACVDILEGPVASFVPSSTSICKNSSISFSNTSTGGSTYFWDFGDGATSGMFNATHTYTAPGIYTACLYATRNNFDAEGNALCCCTDTVCVDIIVDSLEGPNIFCVSTLCANDSTKYWTDAACDSLKWTVQDEDGLPVSFSGQGNDTICVLWGAGPFGTVTLQAMNCDSAYCDEPTTVTIPIISSTVDIVGDTAVCELSSATYTVQKWISVYYDWEVTGAISWTGDSTNTITVQWGAAGTGTITLKYYSDFLGGLPGQVQADCMGTADLTVDIKPRYDIFAPFQSVVCVNDVTTYFATAFPFSTYNWTVTPAASFTGQGTSSITVTWDAGPGTYTITAVPADTTVYCNDIVTKYMRVLEVPPPTGIDGPIEACPGDTYTYFAQTDQTGVGFNWTVTGGTLSSTTGNPVTVTWDVTPPYNYSLSLQQFMLAVPMCSSDTIQLDVQPKLLDSMIAISGIDTVCINSLHNYTATTPQHADATFNWTITQDNLGSVVGGQGTPNIQVQWNNTPDTAILTLTIELCNASISTDIPVFINAPIVPVIIQNDTFCPGVPFTLDAGSGFSQYLWSPSGNITQTISTSIVGSYSVMTTDANGCKASDSYTAVAYQGPPSAPPDVITICNNLPSPPATVTVTAPSGPYTYSWNPPLSTTNTLIHINTFVNATFVYTATLTDANGCAAISTTTVIQTDACPPPPPCTADPASTISFTAANQFPDCNVVDFAATFNNATLTAWYFGDNSSLNAGPLANVTHNYAKAGCYTVILTANVPNLDPHPPGPDFCEIKFTQTVCIPLAADFSYTDSCSTVHFTDQSTFNLPGDVPTNWYWSFGDPAAGMSTVQNPVYSYLVPGPYTVTLIVTNASGCQDTVVKTITVGGAPVPDIGINPDSVCVGEPVSFSNSTANIVSWLWDFKDGSTNGSQNPLHTYLVPGTYLVMLTVTDAEGCTNMNTGTLVVSPLPPDEVITAMPGLTVCDSTVVTLEVPLVSGYTYLWSDSGSSTGNSIMVTEAGTYSVTITDANGCTTVPDPVTVVVIPLPQATISGNHYICDNGCVVLSAPYGQNYTYLWSTGETSRAINACSGSLQSPYSVTVTEPYLNCTAVSAPFDVSIAVSPLFSISPPEGCEGTPTILKVTPEQLNVVYAWNNGATGPSITVSQAGTYIAVGTDTITGCTGSSSAVIHPLPDLCLVPVGCYEACNPDTICGPAGLSNYQWNKDGVPIPGANDSCLVVTQSGNYSLTGTNEFGCALTTDTLMLKLIDCTCYGLSASATPSGTDSCCWNLGYNNPLNNPFGVVIYSDDADLSFDLSTLAPSLMLDVLGLNLIGLSNSIPNTPLPSGMLNDFLSVCLSNVQNTPQQIIFDWYDVNTSLLCSDTLELFSQQILFDTIALCPGETVTLGGMMYTAPATVMLTLPGSGGTCDTLATYYLVLSPAHTVTLSCPSNITVEAVFGDSAAVNYSDPMATSTCPGSVPTVTRISGPASGSAFPIGITEVCYIANDDDNCCSNVDTCCFTVTVNLPSDEPCDEATINCVKYELLDITKDAAGNQTYRIRVTNNCSNKLIYAAFQVPDGITADDPPNNSVYTAPSGHEYDVRNPNFSPFYSIRFKSTTDSISNGESDIFEYTLPPQVCESCLLATVRLFPKIYHQAHLCCVMPGNFAVSPVSHDLLKSAKEVVNEFKTVDRDLSGHFSVFPNPTDGTLFADFSDWQGEQLQVQIFNSQGQRVQLLTLVAGDLPVQVALPESLASGLYFLEVWKANGEKHTTRFILQH